MLNHLTLNIKKIKDYKPFTLCKNKDRLVLEGETPSFSDRKNYFFFSNQRSLFKEINGDNSLGRYGINLIVD